jgi:tetratricopeptide (TPR) repeat protein
MAERIEDDAAQRAEAEIDRGLDLTRERDWVAALAAFEEARSGFEAANDAEGLARATYGTAEALRHVGRELDARARFEAAREGFLESGDPVRAAHALMSASGIDDDRGNHDAALAVLATVREELEAHGDELDLAQCDTNTGVALDRSGRHRDAIEAFGRAREVYSRLDRPLDVALVDCDTANASRDLGELPRALELYANARAAYAGHDDALGVALCDSNLASARIAAGSYEDGLRLLDGARDAYLEHGEVIEAARCLSDSAIALRALGRHEEALARYQIAREIYTSVDRVVDAARCDNNSASPLIRLGRYDEAIQHSSRALSVYEDAGLSHRVPRCRENIGIAHARAERTEESIAELDAAERGYRTQGDIVGAARCAVNIGVALRGSQRHREAIERYRAARAVLADAGEEMSVAVCDLNEAVALEELGEPAPALELALTALGRHERGRYEVRAPGNRAQWSTAHGRYLRAAIRLAGALEEHGVVAELVEHARTQAIPAAAGAGAGLDELPLARPRSIAAGGPPRVPIAPGTDPIDVPALVRKLGGRDALLWGTAVVGRTLWWSVVGAGGVHGSGAIDFAPGAPARAALTRLTAALAVRGEEEDPDTYAARVATSPFVRDPAAEEMLTGDLGRILLPDPIAAACSERGEDEPVPLLVAPAPALGTVPFALLPIDAAGRRLCEAASVRLVPSAALVEHVLARPPRASGAALLTVRDPTGDLDASRAGAPGDLALAGAAATKATIASALRSSMPGAFLYSGHVFRGVAGAPATSALCLERTIAPERVDAIPPSWLTARDLWLEPGDYPLPPLVMLSGCTSSGATAGGAGEWLGLAPAALWAGARAVVATAWDLPDDPATVELESALLEATRRERDVPHAVRAVQLARLRRWRSRSAWEGLMPHSPLVFGSYVAVSVERVDEPV